MTVVTFALMAAKAAGVVLFTLTLAAVLTWTDRRQGAMMADRVGPNRAVVFLPTRLAQVALVVPALAAVGLFLGWVSEHKAEGVERTDLAITYTHLAIAALWVTGLGIAGHVRKAGPRSSFDLAIASLGDPRIILYFGLALHAVALIVQGMLRGTDEGRLLREVGYRSGPALLAFAVVAAAGYAAWVIKPRRRVGIRVLGLLHVVADGLKLVFKEDLIPPKGDRLLHGLAAFVGLFPGLVLLGVVPFGDTLCLATEGGDITGVAMTVPAAGGCAEGYAVPLQVLDLDVGILFFFALAGTGVVGAALAGWSADNKFSLLGGLRAAGQMVFYEVTLGLTVIGALMIYGTLRIDEMVRWQADNAWGIFVQPFAFVLFLAAAIAETKRIPFDLPEGESEIVAGYFTEYSGMKFAMFFFSEYVAMVTTAGLMTALFFGGWHVPFVDPDGLRVAIGETVVLEQSLVHPAVVAIGVVAFVGKTAALCVLLLAIRWTLPRFRYDQLMSLGWRKVLPASLGNIAVTAVVMLALASGSEQVSAALDTLGDLSELLVAVVGLAVLIGGILYWLRPAAHQRIEATSAAKYAEASGGTRTARMGA